MPIMQMGLGLIMSVDLKTKGQDKFSTDNSEIEHFSLDLGICCWRPRLVITSTICQTLPQAR